MKGIIKRFIKKNLYFLIKIRDKYKNQRINKENLKIIADAKIQQKKTLGKLKDKKRYRAIFFALHQSVWKYDTVFKRMIEHPRFEPIILVCPIVNYGRASMIRNMENTYLAFREKGYPVIKSYDKDADTYIDVRKELKPDLIIYTNPYYGLIDNRYYITNFLDILSIYVHYGYNSVTKWDLLYKQLLTNIVWRYYVETPIHLKYVRKHSLNHGTNCIVTGYPGVESLMDNSYKIRKFMWKSKDINRKRIIWAPHHTIEDNSIIKFSTFLRYADFMLGLANRYEDKIQIAFKPHPTLRDQLNKIWGTERTEKYFHRWCELPNTVIVEGEYIDLFLTSDAMIHDSGSFLIEYLYTKKPVMRLMNDANINRLFNSFAKKCLDVYYKGYNEEDIEAFIQDVINGKDDLKEARDLHYTQYLQPYNGKLPSQCIIEDILMSLENQQLYASSSKALTV